MKQTISLKMLQTLRKGVARISPEAKQTVKHYIESQLMPDGLFADKTLCKSDIYYSVFGLMLANFFDVKIPSRISTNHLNINALNLLEYSSLVRVRMLLSMRGLRKFLIPFRKHRTHIPVFKEFPHSDPCSPYSQFLLWSLKEDLRYKITDKEVIIASLENYRLSDGGYSNILPTLNSQLSTLNSKLSTLNSQLSTLNSTVAALMVRGQSQGYNSNDPAVEYLIDIQDDTGGYKATYDAIIPDLLSTATALFVLSCYGVKPRIDPAPFIEAHWLDTGAFASTLPDMTGDIEYTFYGVLALGTL
ncbi:MAG: hypothetical protein LBD53_02160 [Tannerella sp.]|jgi:prenyltransferase beta subunit|nr:hypothetical protein [Tannerella sp.]